MFWPGFRNIDFAGFLQGIDPPAIDRLETLVAYSEDSEAGRPGYIHGKRISRTGDALRLFLVNPLEIEAVINEHPAVRASQVVGIEGPHGLRPVAFVVPSGDGVLDETEIIAYCAKRIGRYKVPERVFPIDAFPVTPSANGDKIQKARLRDIARGAIEVGGWHAVHSRSRPGVDDAP